jgi:ribose 5-phosphate isomerase B
MTRKIYIASDHAGFDLKYQILKLCNEKIIDLGPKSSESVDYPDFAFLLVNKLKNEKKSLGILICGSGIGMSIAANRDCNIRAGLAFSPEIASLMRKHNNANILVLPSRFINVQDALNCVDIFLTTDFDYGRHQKRVDKLSIK